MHHGGVKTRDAVSASYSGESILRNRAAADYIKIRGERLTRSDHTLDRIEQRRGGYRAISVRIGAVKTSGGNELPLRCLS